MNKKNTKKIRGQVVKTQREVAQHFKISIRTVRDRLANGCPGRKGAYNLNEMQTWLDERNKPTSAMLAKEVQDFKLREIKIKREESKLRKELSELMPKREVENALVQLILTFKRSFMSLGRNLAPQLAGREPREIDAMITGRIRRIIEDFSQGKRIFKK